MYFNGFVMFVVKIGLFIFEIFFFDDIINGEEKYSFECCYIGEGIVKGYGFWYFGYKLGLFFVIFKGFFMFVLKEIKIVLML